MTATEAISTKLTFALQDFVRNSNTKFYENPIHILGTDTGSQLDKQWEGRMNEGRGLRIKRCCWFRKERLETKQNNDSTVKKTTPYVVMHVPAIHPWRRQICRIQHLHSWRSTVPMSPLKDLSALTLEPTHSFFKAGMEQFRRKFSEWSKFSDTLIDTKVGLHKAKNAHSKNSTNQCTDFVWIQYG
jgi:hypothetical protein